MPTSERLKWVALVLLTILPVILAFVLPTFIRTAVALPPDPAQLDAEVQVASLQAASPPCSVPYPFPGIYQGAYPSPYPESCAYLPVIFNNSSLGRFLDSILP